VRRKRRRSDRTHVIYRLTCGSTAERYVGLTVVRGRAFLGSARVRFQGHVYRAILENGQGPLSNRIRAYGPSDFQVEILERVRGKNAAHLAERRWVQSTAPELNVLLRETEGRNNQ
jgi:hypothetical protein